MDQLRDAGGAVTRFSLGPKWLMPPIVVATSPEAIRGILSNKHAVVDKTTRVLREFRHIIGANLFDLPHEPWLPRRRTLQPVFTKQRVRQFGGHMAEAAESVAAAWRDGATVNLDAECRTLTLRALGRSVRDVQDLTELSTAFADELGDLQKEFQELVQIPATASPALVLLLPDSFIGIAESMDLAGELGRWVLRNACAEFSRWRSRGVGQIAVLHSMCRLCNWRPGFGAEPSQSRSCQVCLAPTPG